MYVRVLSFALEGIDAVPVTVEVDVSPGIPFFEVVGLPDAAVRESRERVRAAIRNGGWPFPPQRITVNLAPAHTRKGGAGFDLAIALGVLAAGGYVPEAALEGMAVAGELALDGGLRKVAGALAMAVAAQKAGCRALLMPPASACEAAAINGTPVYSAGDLNQVIDHLTGRAELSSVSPAAVTAGAAPPGSDLAHVRGQIVARRALEVAAAGGHNLVMLGDCVLSVSNNLITLDNTIT